ncbi:MAG: hypothetical protein EVA89_06900 [Sandaracinaceae bacterium]|nr:MAG: hypothetical protein EVA89_06900 [Sandaracinaceae bacterium]
MLGPGLAYDSRRDRFTGWGAGDTRVLFHLSKGDWAWTTETPEAGATPPPINDHGVYGRFQYAPEYDVFILAVTVDGPVLMYEPVDWSPDQAVARAWAARDVAGSPGASSAWPRPLSSRP